MLTGLEGWLWQCSQPATTKITIGTANMKKNGTAMLVVAFLTDPGRNVRQLQNNAQ